MRNAVAAFTLLAGTVLLPFASYADDSDARVARVSYVSADVSYQRGDDEGWNGLRVNTPLVTGDSIYAPAGGRAEVDLGSGNVIRVDGGTQVDLINHTRAVTQLGLTGGLLDLRARSFPRGFTLEIDTPSGAVTILGPGRYRVEVADRVATYSVVRGGMSLALDGQQLDVREGESLQLEDTDPPTYGYGRLVGGTPFQDWADNRDSRFERSGSARYVNADVVGYEDLDDHGSWRESRDYGRIWVPSGMSEGWAPYQSGRWIWQDPYGWTWVSAESWGWAPYHYGRWVRTGHDWGWVPPPPPGYRGPAVVMDIQPVYAPALVAFVGGKNWGLSLSIGGAAIGWVPLAPAERYYYPWQSAPRVTNNYTNITVINAVTVVNYNTFATDNVRPIRVARAQIEQAPVIGFTAAGVVPTRGSLVVSPERNQTPKTIPRGRTERPLVARLVPPPKQQPFAQKVAQIEKTGRPVAGPVVIEGAVGKPFVRGAQAPAGVKPFTAPAPEGRKELKAQRDVEVRAPKKIEHDIELPTPAPDDRRAQPQSQPAGQPEARKHAAAPPPAPVAVAPPPVKPDATPAKADRKVQTDPRSAEQQDARKHAAAPPPVPVAVTPPPVKPDATPAKAGRQVQTDPRPAGRQDAKKHAAPPMPPPAPVAVAPPPVKPDATPAKTDRQVQTHPRPAGQQDVKKDPAPTSDQAKPIQPVPKKKKKVKDEDKDKDKDKDKDVPAPTPPPD